MVCKTVDWGPRGDPGDTVDVCSKSEHLLVVMDIYGRLEETCTETVYESLDNWIAESPWVDDFAGEWKVRNNILLVGIYIHLHNCKLERIEVWGEGLNSWLDEIDRDTDLNYK